MDSTILLRDFEERDIEFIYHCKNNQSLSEMIVGQFRPFTMEEATRWVHGCKGDHCNYKFWAICTNDDERRIVGWVSLSEIDKESRSACHHGLVIGDKSFNDGIAMFEAMLLSMDFAFIKLGIHRLYGCCFSEHKITPHMNEALGFVLEGRRRDAFYKDNRYYDLLEYGMLDTEFFKYKESGRYNINTLVRYFVKSLKRKNNIDLVPT